MKRIVMIAAMALASAVAFAQAPKFAHVNYSELVQLSPAADEARAVMTASSKEAQETDDAMREEFTSKYQTYQQKAASWTPAIRESKERELADIQQRIQEFEANIQAELQQQQNMLMAPIMQAAQDAVKEVAQKGGYIYVFEVTNLLYFDPAQSEDITPACRALLGIPEDRTLESLQAELQAQQ